ncbi:hypothetical protein ACVDG8_012365 [Mesorhizobium sp. ORM8.1]
MNRQSGIYAPEGKSGRLWVIVRDEGTGLAQSVGGFLSLVA